MPKHMPNTGCLRLGISTSNPLELSFFIALLACPTPGNIILSELDITSLSDVNTPSQPSLLRAYLTL